MELRSGAATAQIEVTGGRLASLRVHGLELLVSSSDRPTRWGSFPMVPWCGRLRNGQLDHEGTTYDFPLTSPPHANHGIAHLRRWDEVAPGTIRVALDEPWPFGGFVEQRFELGEHALTVTISVHADTVPMPAMAGWHPWFRRQLDAGDPAILHLAGGSVFLTDHDGVPTGQLGQPQSGPLDACFTNLEDDPRITWPGALSLTVSSTFDHWVIFTEPEHAMCVEPESGAPNDLNRNPTIVEPGIPLVGSMTLAWAADPT